MKRHIRLEAEVLQKEESLWRDKIAQALSFLEAVQSQANNQSLEDAQSLVNKTLETLAQAEEYVQMLAPDTANLSDKMGIESKEDPSVLTAKEINAKASALYAKIQVTGIPIDTQALQDLINKNKQQLDEMLKDLQGKFGFLPNPNKADHYAQIAEKAGYPLPKSPTGKTKTDVWTIERAAKDVPALVELSNARKVRMKLSKLESLSKSVKDGKVYPTYSLDEELGRTHAGGDANPMNWEPDMQGLVKDGDNTILVVDYERMEPKVLATLSADKQFQADLKADPYTELAKTIFNTQQISPEQRSVAKVAMLASIYGQEDRVLAARLGVSVYQAARIQAAWHKRYPQAFNFLQQLKQSGRATGQAVSYHGRVKALNKPDPEANDRLAVNSVMQNTAGDLARIGFANVASDPRVDQLGVKIITTVHDSMILSIPKGVDVEEVKTIVKQDMVDGNDSNFGLSISFKQGSAWGTAR